MPKFRKKPVVIEAFRFSGPDMWEDLQEFARGDALHQFNPVQRPDGAWTLEVSTLEGTMTASYGDWIIKGVNGEFYPCKPDIFEKTYEPVVPVSRTGDAA